MTPYYRKDNITIYCDNCLGIMPKLDITFDAIITDLPYGTTNLKWDTVIPLNDYVVIDDKQLTRKDYLIRAFSDGLIYNEAVSFWNNNHIKGLWWHYDKISKNNAAIALNASQPFTTLLINSNPKHFRYEWVWIKNKGSNYSTLKYQPFKENESVLIFYKDKPTYNPQKIPIAESSIVRDKLNTVRTRNVIKSKVHKITGMTRLSYTKKQDGKRNPSSVIYFNMPMGKNKVNHPTQKPVALMAYMIRTYTNKGEIVLDNTMGSGTTLVAAQNEGRRAVGIELDEEYCKIAVERLRQKSIFSFIGSDKGDNKETEQQRLL